MADFIKLNGVKILAEDIPYIVDKPSPNFSPERNKKVIAESIRKAEAKRRQAWKEWEKPARERTEALAFYLKHLDQGKNTSVEKYFGQEYLRYLRGQSLLQRVKKLARKQKYAQFY